MNIPIAHSFSSLEQALLHIQQTSPPAIVTTEYLKSIPIKKADIREIPKILRLLGFLDEDMRPTPRWLDYQSNSKPSLQAAIKECYNDLFIAYPDAPQLADAVIADWFAPPRTKATPTSQVRALRAFRRLCRLAGLPEAPMTPPTPTFAALTESPVPERTVQLVLPPGLSEANYEAIFRAALKAQRDTA